MESGLWGGANISFNKYPQVALPALRTLVAHNSTHDWSWGPLLLRLNVDHA